MSKNLSARAVFALTVLFVAGISVLGGSSAAFAHDDLVTSYPRADATVATSPDEITLTFSGELADMDGSSVIEVINDDGQNVAADTPDISGTSITQHLSPATTTGLFTVRWKVVSSDGHPISDEYVYTVESAAVTPVPSESESESESESTVEQKPEPSASPSETPSSYGSSPTGGGEFSPFLYLLVVAMVLVGGVVGVLLMAYERRLRERAAEAKETSDEK